MTASHWPISLLSSASALVNMIAPLIMVRLLTPDEIGTFKIFFLYVLLMPAFSLTSGLLNGLAYWAGAGEAGLRAIRQSNAFVIAGAFFLSIACLALYPMLAHRLGWPPIYSVYFAASVLGAICINFLEESAIVTGRIWFGAIYTSVTEVLRSVTIIAVAWLTRDLGSILLASATLALLKVATSITLGRRMGYVDFQLDRGLAREVWKYALPVSLAWLFGVFSNAGDQFVLSNVITPAEFALYAIGCLSIPPLQILEQSVTRVMIPRLSESFAAGNASMAARTYRDGVSQLAWILIPATAGLVVFAEPIITLLFTERYAAAAAYCQWFALTYLLLIIPHDAVPRARGEGHWIMKTVITFAIVPLGLCLGLGAAFGAFGALAGLLISRFAQKAYAVVYVRRSTGWKLAEFLPLGNIGAYAGLSVLLSLASLAARPLFSSELTWLLTCGPVFLLLYFPSALLLTNLVRRARGIQPGETGRVLLFSQHLRIGGLERMVLALGRSLRKTAQWEVFLFSHDSEENADSHTDRTLIKDFLESGIQVDALKKGRGISLLTLYRLLRNIYRNRIDVIHTHDMGTLIYAVLANFLSLYRVRIVHTQHSFAHFMREENAARYARYERLFTRFVDVLTVVNESLIEPYVQLGVPRERIEIVKNGVAFLEAPLRDRGEKISRRTAILAQLKETERAGIEPHLEDRWILYLARLQSVKGQREAAQVWRDLKPEVRKQAAFFLIGPEAEDGELARVLEVFERLPDRDRVHIIDGTRTPHEWIKASDLFLSCSRIEGMPLSPLEAIGSGLPAVLSGIHGHRFLAEASFQFRPEAHEEAASLIEEILLQPSFGTPEYYGRLWEGADWVRRQYSIDSMADRYVTHYRGKG